MAVGVAAVVAVIVAFKAAGAWRGLLLPLGVSYYSFKLISYLIEVYWDDEAVERDPVVFFLFPAFFPQIVSGPIQRPEPFFAQMREVMGRTLDPDQVETGFRFILGGLMMKTAGRRPPRRLHRGRRPVARRLFSYSVMLTTVACYTLAALCRLRRLYEHRAWRRQAVRRRRSAQLPCARSRPSTSRRFWRRWHMSLTSWVTDYLFTPAVDVAARSWPGRARLVHHAEYGHHRLVARADAQFSRFRPLAGRLGLCDGARRPAASGAARHTANRPARPAGGRVVGYWPWPA